MKLNYKHAILIVMMAVLISTPVVAASNAGNTVVAQDTGSDFFTTLLQNGAEVVYSSIDSEGVPTVVYGQLGVPSARLGLEDPSNMYDGCVAMALIATQGELLNYIMDFVGGGLFNTTGAGNGEFIPAQDSGTPFDMNSIMDMLGSNFTLLINVFVNLSDADAHTNMAEIRTYLHNQYQFSFSELLDLRIDESTFPSDMNINLPFSGVNLFIYKVTDEFNTAVDKILGVMDQGGFLQSIDSSVFMNAPASGAGLLAIPDMAELTDLINGFGGFSNSTSFSPGQFLISQVPDMQGPLAIVAAGYIGDQVLSTTSNQIKIFQDLLGKGAVDTVTGLTTGQSIVACVLPQDVNITSYSPEDEALNQTYYDNTTGTVFWNATYYNSEPDYIINFDPGAFPPKVTIDRSFSPKTVKPGGTVDVSVVVHNDGLDPVQNVSLADLGIGSIYSDLTIEGSQSTTALTLPADGYLTISYTVTFPNEGGYLFPKATLSYNYNNETHSKTTHIDGYTVSPDPLGLLMQLITDGMPYTGIAIGVIGLGAIVNIGLMARGRHGGSYQV